MATSKTIFKCSNEEGTVSQNELNETKQTIDLLNKINEGIADIKVGRIMSFEEAKEKLL